MKREKNFKSSRQKAFAKKFYVSRKRMPKMRAFFPAICNVAMRRHGGMSCLARHCEYCACNIAS